MLIRKRNGGIQLVLVSKGTNIGMIMRDLEQDLPLLECFNKETSHCILSLACKLKHALHEALEAFFSALDQATRCVICNKSVSNKVERYCLQNKKRFNGNVYCYEHQQSM